VEEFDWSLNANENIVARWHRFDKSACLVQFNGSAVWVWVIAANVSARWKPQTHKTFLPLCRSTDTLWRKIQFFEDWTAFGAEQWLITLAASYAVERTNEHVYGRRDTRWLSPERYVAGGAKNTQAHEKVTTGRLHSNSQYCGRKAVGNHSVEKLCDQRSVSGFQFVGRRGRR